MSSKNYEEAIELAKKCDGYEIGSGKSEKVVKDAEKLLKLKFSKQTKQYFENLGFLEFYGHEFYGMTKEDFSGNYVGNAVEATLFYRYKLKLPEDWIPIFDFNNGYMAYLDYSHLNEEEEPRVIMAIYTGKGYKVTEVIAEDLGDFLLQMVKQQLVNQTNELLYLM